MAGPRFLPVGYDQISSPAVIPVPADTRHGDSITLDVYVKGLAPRSFVAYEKNTPKQDECIPQNVAPNIWIV